MFPIDLRRRRRGRSDGPSEPETLLLFETVGRRQVVAHACARALGAGIAPGMALSAARGALGPRGLVVEEHDPRRTRRALRALAVWCQRFSPFVAEEDDAGLCLDITGCAHLFGGERAMAERARSSLAGLGFTARVAVAPTFSAARAAARHGGAGVSVVAAHELHGVVSAFPVGALGMEKDVASGLAEVNVQGIGELIALPRASVAARFGDELLLSLDRLLGRAGELVEPIRVRAPVMVERVFEGPCACVATIGAAVRGLLGALSAALAERGLGVVEWRVVLGRSDLEALEIPLRHCAPSRDAGHLWRLVEPRLERAHLGFGVESVRLVADRALPAPERQGAWWEGVGLDGAGGAAGAGALIDALVNRLGAESVLRAEMRESHVPERAVAMRCALDGPASSAARCAGDRPTRLLSAPDPMRVIALSPDGPIRRVEWRGIEHRITACVGPERIRGAWWEGERLLRDYFKVQDEQGRWLWVCHDHARNGWFVHGLWD